MRWSHIVVFFIGMSIGWLIGACVQWIHDFRNISTLEDNRKKAKKFPPMVRAWKLPRGTWPPLKWVARNQEETTRGAKRFWPRKRKKTKDPKYLAAFNKWVKSERATPYEAWPKYAQEHGLDPRDEGLKENFVRAMYRYKP